MRHITVGLFVPHKGCPHQCSFCNQKSISGQVRELTQEDIHRAVKKATENPEVKMAEIAFFGGSFTAIDREYMLSLLKTAAQYVDNDRFKGIRISTRPDCIDDEICRILKENKVTAVELGAQSMCDEVLRLNQRGHTARDVEIAVGLLKAHGFETGLQMMTGLYGSDYNESIETAQKIIAISPDTVRIYPTVVLEGTRLAELFSRGEYSPQSVESAVEICSQILMMFHKADIRVIRVGLHSGGNVEEGFLAGAYHPAFKELCESRIYYKIILDELKSKNITGGTVYVPKGALSQALGQKKQNLQKLSEKGYNLIIKETDNLNKYQVIIKEKSYDT